MVASESGSVIGYFLDRQLTKANVQCNILNQQLKEKDLEVADAEEQTYWHGLQDELHASERNAKLSQQQQILEARTEHFKKKKKC